MFKKVVNALEIVALGCAVVFVVALFITPKKSSTSTTGGTANGQAIFAQNCATCHGDNGEGALGPQLAGGAVLKDFPNAEAQVAFVSHGGGGMPAFGDRLSEDEIKAVVDYTRTVLANK
jgi:mono/diheme cytochrome c family protein